MNKPHITLIYGPARSGKSWIGQACVNQAVANPTRATTHATCIEVFTPEKLPELVDEALKKNNEIFVSCNGFVPSAKLMAEHRPEARIYTIEATHAV